MVLDEASFLIGDAAPWLAMIIVATVLVIASSRGPQSDLPSTVRRLATGLMAASIVLIVIAASGGLHWVPGRRLLQPVPFRTISGYLGGDAPGGARNLVGNILLFVPFGFGLAAARLSRRASIGAAVGLTLAIETYQYVTGGRAADIDDVTLNLGGSALGVAAWNVLLRWSASRWPRLAALGRPASATEPPAPVPA